MISLTSSEIIHSIFKKLSVHVTYKLYQFIDFQRKPTELRITNRNSYNTTDT